MWGTTLFGMEQGFVYSMYWKEQSYALAQSCIQSQSSIVTCGTTFIMTMFAFLKLGIFSTGTSTMHEDKSNVDTATLLVTSPNNHTIIISPKGNPNISDRPQAL